MQDNKKKKMLLVVDPQIDFITGSLPVPGAAEAMDKLAAYIDEHGNDYVVKMVTSDWHSYRHCSFDRNGGPWPPHCIQHSVGAALWPALLEALNRSKGGFTMLYKGEEVDRDEYSVMDNRRQRGVVMSVASALGIDRIDVCGLAGDVCVLNTARGLAEALGREKVNVMTQFAPSLDGGKALAEFVG